MTLPSVQRAMPEWLRRYVLHFEAAIEDAVAACAQSLAPGARVLDAGAGEGRYKRWFVRHRYIGADLAIGDPAWSYAGLDVITDLERLPFRDAVFDAALNIVTLEHVREPARVLSELHRTLVPGGSLLLIVPQEWEVHQQPHDYYRYTRFGVAHLLECAGFTDLSIRPVGGYFRLLARRLLNGLQFFRGPLVVPAAVLLVPPALVLPLFERLDRTRSFTLGYVCTARRS
ncbi:MAG TPA: class I SAM-dependent methyltransferase [Bryobacteraceae bacterium]|nr:class I SAM-dependent methyltransferase [Bryobacteraceae bacterium]